MGVFNIKTVFPLITLAGYVMTIANSYPLHTHGIVINYNDHGTQFIVISGLQSLALTLMATLEHIYNLSSMWLDLFDYWQIPAMKTNLCQISGTNE